MGLTYSASDSSAVITALTANLAAGLAELDVAKNACSRLGAALKSGALSGKAYSAVDRLFAQIINPCIADAKKEITAIQGDLSSYSQADAQVSRYGVLKEDELNAQLTATERQRDETERLIESNRTASEAAVTMPAVSASLETKNEQLQLVLTQLEKDIQTLQEQLRALRDFASRTAGLFVGRLADLAAATGDTVSLLYDLNSKTNLLTAGGGALSVWRVYDYLAGRKLTRDSQGRIKLESRFIYKPSSRHLYNGGREFNAGAGVRIDHYGQPLKAGLSSAVTSVKDTVNDFRGWKDASTFAKGGKFLGAAGTVLTVGSNANAYFHDGVEGDDVPDFIIDTGVDLGSAAAAAGFGAAIGSFFLPPAGTVIGAGVGLVADVLLDWDFGGGSAVDWAKEGLKNAWDWASSKFW